MAPRAAASPEALIETILGYRRAKVLLTAATLDLFSRLEQARPAWGLASELELDPRACEVLLDALTALGYLRKKAGRYQNTAISRRFLVRGQPGYLGNNLRYQDLVWGAWGELEDCVRRGGSARPLDYWLRRQPGFAQEYIGGMAEIAERPAAELAALFPTRGPASLLDVGAGPGAYSVAFLRRNQSLRATLLDLPSTLKIARRLLPADSELRRRIRLRAGDYRRVGFGVAEHDVVLLSHVTHDESPEVNRELIAKAHVALRPGGRVLIHDFMVQEGRTRPEFGALFSVHMLTYTEGGRTYTAREYKSWLKSAGFRDVGERPICAQARNATRVVAGVK